MNLKCIYKVLIIVYFYTILMLFEIHTSEHLHLLLPCPTLHYATTPHHTHPTPSYTPTSYPSRHQRLWETPYRTLHLTPTNPTLPYIPCPPIYRHHRL